MKRTIYLKLTPDWIQVEPYTGLLFNSKDLFVLQIVQWSPGEILGKPIEGGDIVFSAKRPRVISANGANPIYLLRKKDVIAR